MPQPSARTVAALAGLAALAAALGGCSSTSRFDGMGAQAATRRAPPPAAPLEPVAPAAPAGAVSSAPLAPPPGAAAAPEAAPLGAGAPVVVEAAPPVQQQASIAPPPIAAPAPSGRSSVVGGWNAQEASGGSCRVQLSSSPALDLYKATAAGCANRDLARVTAWDYRDGEVYLYQPGGTVAARLRAGGGGLEGVIAKSSAPLSLKR